MGLVKRGSTWWMSFMYQGQQVRRSTETTDKRLAEAILGKLKVQIIDPIITGNDHWTMLCLMFSERPSCDLW